MNEMLAARFGDLTLVWLLVRKDGKGGKGELAKALKPLFEHRLTAAEHAARLEEALVALEAGGQGQRTARGGLALTDEGRKQALSWLELERLPPGISWARLKRGPLLARALALPPTEATYSTLAQADGVRAVLLQRAHGLDSVPRTAAQLRDALCWKSLGVESEKPFTLATVRAVLLGRLLQSERAVDSELAVRQLAARAAGATRGDADSLCVASLRKWLLPSQPAPTPASEPDLQSFAAQVRAAAEAATSGRFGTDRVFISHLFRQLQPQLGMDEQAFKEKLVEANRARLLSLSRADLVEVMDPRDVASSEVRYLGATFHFVSL